MTAGLEAGEPEAGAPDRAVSDGQRGQAIVSVSWLGTLAFAVTAVPTIVPWHAFDGAAVVGALVLFAAAIPIWLVAFVHGVSRSRLEIVTISGLFFLQGTGVRAQRRLLLGSLAVTLAITTLTASAEPFGVLVPVLPLALCGLWSARHGTFAQRPAPAARTHGRPPASSPPLPAAEPGPAGGDEAGPADTPA